MINVFSFVAVIERNSVIPTRKSLTIDAGKLPAVEGGQGQGRRVTAGEHFGCGDESDTAAQCFFEMGTLTLLNVRAVLSVVCLV